MLLKSISPPLRSGDTRDFCRSTMGYRKMLIFQQIGMPQFSTLRISSESVRCREIAMTLLSKLQNRCRACVWRNLGGPLVLLLAPYGLRQPHQYLLATMLGKWGFLRRSFLKRRSWSKATMPSLSQQPEIQDRWSLVTTKKGTASLWESFLQGMGGIGPSSCLYLLYCKN